MPGQVLHVLHGHVLAQQVGDHHDAETVRRDGSIRLAPPFSANRKTRYVSWCWRSPRRSRARAPTPGPRCRSAPPAPPNPAAPRRLTGPGFRATAWRVTRASKKCRSAASARFRRSGQVLDEAPGQPRRHLAELDALRFAPGEKAPHGARAEGRVLSRNDLQRKASPRSAPRRHFRGPPFCVPWRAESLEELVGEGKRLRCARFCCL